jgi:hypothetical protein
MANYWARSGDSRRMRIIEMELLILQTCAATRSRNIEWDMQMYFPHGDCWIIYDMP